LLLFILFLSDGIVKDIIVGSIRLECLEFFDM